MLLNPTAKQVLVGALFVDAFFVQIGIYKRLNMC